MIDVGSLKSPRTQKVVLLMEEFKPFNSKSELTHSGCFLTIFTALAQCAKCGVFSILVCGGMFRMSLLV